MDMAQVQRVLSAEVDYTILALSLVFGLVANVIRGLRWHLLVMPIVPQGERPPKLLNAICSVLGSYTISMGIPRAGELWRCAEYQRYERLGFTTLFGTLVSDRLTDITALGVILLGVFAVYHEAFLGYIQELDVVNKVAQLLEGSSLYILGGVALVLILVTCLLYRRFSSKIRETLANLLRGILSIWHMPSKGLFLCYTILIWLGYFGFFYTTFFAFPFTSVLPLEAGVIGMAMSTMSVLAPVQAGVGPWHFMVITTLVSYGVAREDAGAFALIVHTTQTLWITLVGLIAIIALPLQNRRYQRIDTPRDKNETI